MNLHFYLGGLGIIGGNVFATQLDSDRFKPLMRFLETDPTAHLFGLAMLEQWGISGLAHSEWWGVDGRDGELKAVAFAGDWRRNRGFGLVVPMGDPEFANPMGVALRERGGAGWMVGERTITDQIWQSMSDSEPRLLSRQLLMETSAPTKGPVLAVRPAQLSDTAGVHQAAQQMLIDDLGIDPSGDDPVGFLRSIEASISAENEFVAIDGRDIVYRVKVDPRGGYGAQIGGIWVPPKYRSRGVGQRGTRAIVNQLLSAHPRVTLYVREDNVRAVQCYRAVGFRHVRDFRLLVR